MNRSGERLGGMFLSSSHTISLTTLALNYVCVCVCVCVCVSQYTEYWTKPLLC